ncbi:GH92 family glycosyl hydrolase [Thermophagus sp. OGC60D27]|uniref:GH92 family glycosyl hydrolase n=1 Tax=Thermophagus sp. OGC60D27 TaxID=3458415 RepID=UPI004037E991
MVIQRSFFRIMGSLFFLSLGLSCEVNNDGGISDSIYAKKVYPLLGTNHSRWFFFSSASRPFGMVNLSPDTEIDGAWESGYKYDSDTVKGFSHIHAWQLAGPSIMPINPDLIDKRSMFHDYYSSFNHQTEQVFPGYHQLFLDRYQIKAELTSTKRVGFHRYTSDGKIALLFNLNGQLGPSFMNNGIIKAQEPTLITGQVTNLPTFRRPKPCTVYFAAQFNSPIEDIERDPSTGNYVVYFENQLSKPLKVKLAISYTSVENAEINMKEELSGWEFYRVVNESVHEWDAVLSRIEIEGGTEEEQQRFYTDLWHALQGRRIISDVNGAYPDNFGDEFRIGQLPLNDKGEPLFNHYNSDSFWGAQWTLNTLWGLVYPEMMDEFVQSLMQYYRDGGLIPRGPSGGNYTYVMTGASSNPFIISAIQKGIVKDDLENIYQALRKNQMPGGIMEKIGYEHNTNIGGGLLYYMEKGYVPYPLSDVIYGSHQDGASQTLEYAYQDWALAQLAKKMNKTDDFRYFLGRSYNYKNLFDSISGWMRPKNKEGQWKADFDPYQYENGFIEANGAQNTWFVPHDIEGLSQLMGGDEAVSFLLNQSFVEAEKLGFTAGSSHQRERHPEFVRIPINYGNQPSIQTAFIFNYLGKPWLTQYWSRRVVEEVYEDLSPDQGYNGDEDQGMMGSLAVLMKMGLFSMKGGCSLEPILELGSPVFDRITIQLNPRYYSGEKLVIEVRNNSDQNRYIQSAQWNGKALQNWYVLHNDIVKGGTLILNMGKAPNEQWATK